ncbi:MAG: hypothetical protein GC150_11635 [Rhizobiales bacterium]|nr:hypothetical protein [Hyphomicrobiales bacterium]
MTQSAPRGRTMDISRAAEAAGIAFAGHWVISLFAGFALTIFAGERLLTPNAAPTNGWDDLVAGPLSAAILLGYAVLLPAMGYGRRYLLALAALSGSLGVLILAGVLVGAALIFSWSWAFAITLVLLGAIYGLLILGALSHGVLAYELATMPRAPDDPRRLIDVLDAPRWQRAGGGTEDLGMPARIPARIPFLGPVLSGIGLLGIAAMPVLLTLQGLASELESPWAEPLAEWAALFLIGLPASGALLVLGRRLSQPDANTLLAGDDRPPILLLRSFADDDRAVRGKNVLARYVYFGLLKDRRLEAVAADELSRVGPFIAIGQPGERLPRLGAARAYFDDDNWQAAVLDWMRGAAMIVVVVGRTPWVRWELETIAANGLATRSLLVCPPDDEAGRAARWELARESLSGSPHAEAFAGLDPARTLAVRLEDDGSLTAIVSETRKEIDYEIALRLLIALERGPRGKSPREAPPTSR